MYSCHLRWSKVTIRNSTYYIPTSIPYEYQIFFIFVSCPDRHFQYSSRKNRRFFFSPFQILHLRSFIKTLSQPELSFKPELLSVRQMPKLQLNSFSLEISNFKLEPLSVKLQQSNFSRTFRLPTLNDKQGHPKGRRISKLRQISFKIPLRQSLQ